MSVSQARLFQRLRWTLLRNSGSLLVSNSRVRLVSILVSCAIVWAAIFFIAFWGFGELQRQKIPIGLIVELIFNAMFLTLGGMLVFSTALVLYAALFNGSETRFLLTTPATADRIFASKFQGAIGYSSWAFVVLGVPALVGYGVAVGVPWYFYVALPLFFLGYVLIPGGLGAIFCFVFVNIFPQKRKQALIACVVVVAGLVIYWAYQTLSVAREGLFNRDQLQQLFGMFTMAKGDLSPVDWMARGLLDVSRGEPRRAILPLALIWSNGLLLYLVSAWCAKKLYRRGFNRMATGGERRRRFGITWMDRMMEWTVFYLPRPQRILVVKDFRTFRREPAQIGQLSIFIGLLLLAVLNSRQFFDADIPVGFQHGLSLLNIAASGLLMCAYLGRFVYPLISLEGKKFWILGLLPLKREQLLWSKFAFAVSGGILLAGSILLLADILLGMSLLTIAVHSGVVVMLAVGLSGMSVGISAWMPNFRETDPSKIVLGVGGTVNMLAGLGFLAVTVGAVCGPYHTASATAGDGALPWWAFAGIPPALILTILAAAIPMRMGVRSIRTIEF